MYLSKFAVLGTPIQSTDDEATAAFCLQLPGSTLDCLMQKSFGAGEIRRGHWKPCDC